MWGSPNAMFTVPVVITIFFGGMFSIPKWSMAARVAHINGDTPQTIDLKYMESSDE